MHEKAETFFFRAMPLDISCNNEILQYQQIIHQLACFFYGSIFPTNLLIDSRFKITKKKVPNNPEFLYAKGIARFRSNSTNVTPTS